MHFEPFKVSQLSEITATFDVAKDPSLGAVVLRAAFRGHAYNGHGQYSFRHIESMMAYNMIATVPDATILDLRELKYDWGDEMAGVLFYCTNHPIESGEIIPVAVVTSELNSDGLTSLVRDEMQESLEDWLFPDMDAALASIERRLAKNRPDY